MKQKWIKPKEERDKSTVRVETSYNKGQIKCAVNQYRQFTEQYNQSMGSTVDIYRTLHPIREYIFFSNLHSIYFKTDHTPGHKYTLTNLKAEKSHIVCPKITMELNKKSATMIARKP